MPKDLYALQRMKLEMKAIEKECTISPSSSYEASAGRKPKLIRIPGTSAMTTTRTNTYSSNWKELVVRLRIDSAAIRPKAVNMSIRLT